MKTVPYNYESMMLKEVNGIKLLIENTINLSLHKTFQLYTIIILKDSIILLVEQYLEDVQIYQIKLYGMTSIKISGKNPN
jgi:hypothetical protein